MADSVARVFVPGRIEVLGKHTDYAGGSSLLVAIERGLTFESGPRDGDQVVIRSGATGEEVGYRIRGSGSGTAVEPVPADPGPGRSGIRPRVTADTRTRPGWARYAEAVLHRVAADFGEGMRGAHVAFTSTLPAAAGLSSSSALVTGLFLALDAVCRFSELDAFRSAVPDAAGLATWLSAAEMGGPVGTRGGSEDHTAILLSRPGRVVRYAFAPVRYRGSAPVPPGWTFAVGASGVVAEKGGAVQARYNRLSDLAADAARAWAAGRSAAGLPAAPPGTEPESSPGPPTHLGRARRESGDDDALIRAVRVGAGSLGLEPAPLVARARHFLEESALVDAAYAALAAADVATFAAAVNRSADRGATLLDNQVQETLALATLARELGAPAASPFGGGFGGAVWALVSESEADAFVVAWETRYRGRFPGRDGAEFFVTGAGRPAEGIPRFD